MTDNANYPSTNTPAVGKRIVFGPDARDDAAILRKAAREGFYYPMLALKQISSLATGAAGKDNVFIPEMNTAQANSYQMFEMYMPGIKASIERRPNDSYIVTSLTLSDRYKSIGRGGDKPGIYSVSKDAGAMKVSYKSNGKITPKDGRVIVVCDTGYQSPQDAASDSFKRLKKTAGRVIAENGEFDILYSPANQSLGGNFKRYNALTNTDAQVFSGILANAMIDAKKKERINWIAEYGGSAVFTQALSQMDERKIDFKAQKHTAYMYHPRTNPDQALVLAHRVGLQIGDEFASVKGIIAPLRMLGAKAKRARNPDDAYSWKDYSKDLSNGSMNGIALAGVGLFIAGFATSAPAVALAGTVTSGIGGAQLIWTKGKNLWSNPKK